MLGKRLMGSQGGLIKHQSSFFTGLPLKIIGNMLLLKLNPFKQMAHYETEMVETLSIHDCPK